MFHYVACGLPNVWLANGYTETTDGSGDSYFNIADIKELHTAIAHSLVEKESRLTGAEFRFLRSELKMSRKTLGELIDYTADAVKKWEYGENPIPKLADANLRKFFLEIQHEGGEIRALLTQIKNLERQERKLCFTETQAGWEAQIDQCA